MNREREKKNKKQKKKKQQKKKKKKKQKKKKKTFRMGVDTENPRIMSNNIGSAATKSTQMFTPVRKHAHVLYRFFLNCKNRKFSVEIFEYFFFILFKT